MQNVPAFHRTFTKTDYIIGHEEDLSRFQRIKTTQTGFSDYFAMKVEIKNKNLQTFTSGKNSKDRLINTSGVKSEIIEFFRNNGNENNIFVDRENFIALNWFRDINFKVKINTRTSHNYKKATKTQENRKGLIKTKQYVMSYKTEKNRRTNKTKNWFSSKKKKVKKKKTPITNLIKEKQGRKHKYKKLEMTRGKDPSK